MTDLDLAFGPQNKLKNYTINIGEINLPPEDIRSFEVKFERNNPRVFASLVIGDLIDINLQQDWEKSEVEVFYMDMFDNWTIRKYKILKIIENYTKKWKKTFNLLLQDTFSYTMQNIYISKGFKDTSITAAFNSFIENYNLKNLLSPMDLKYVIQDDENVLTFTIPKNENVLDFFIKKYADYGYSIFQLRDGLYVLNKELIDASNIDYDIKKEDEYLTETDNQLYKNKVYDIKSVFLNRDIMNEVPKIHTTYFDFETKRHKKFIKNVDTLISDITLNDNVFNFQEQIGNKIQIKNITDNFGSIDTENSLSHENMIKEKYLKMSELEIIVSGYLYRNFNEIIKINIKGNIGSVESQQLGNIINSGYYLVTGIVDKIVGDTMLQKLYINRPDLQKKPKA